MLTNSSLAVVFRSYIDDFRAPARKERIQIIRSAMKFLCPYDQVNVRQAVDQLLAPALGHATHEAKQDARSIAADFGSHILHFPEGFLLSQIAHAAGVEQDDVGGRFSR